MLERNGVVHAIDDAHRLERGADGRLDLDGRGRLPVLVLDEEVDPVQGPRLGRVIRVRAVPLERAEEVLEAASPRVRGKVRRNPEERVQARIALAEEVVEVLALDLA